MAEPDPIQRLGYAVATLKVNAELAQWRRLGVRPLLWWRDDDARAPGQALDRLLALADGRPLALAVIPDGDLSDLASRLSGERHVTIGQHGVDHTNRRPAGQAPSEYARPPNAEEIGQRVAVARDLLRAAGLDPVFYTPPWNAIEPGLGRAVLRSGIAVLSAGASAPVYADLRYLPAEIDVLRWKGGSRFKGAVRIMSALHRALAKRRQAREFALPIGLLTHHLDHDEAAWRFLDWGVGFFDRRFDWVGVDGVVQPRGVVRTQAPAVQPMAQALGV